MSISKAFSITLLVTLSVPQLCFGQDISWSINAVYGSYQMKSMKDFQEELYNDVVSSINVPFKITDNFPGFIGYEISAEKQLDNKLFVGFKLAMMSTGGRISYADYSGKYSIDNKLQNYEGRGVIGTTVHKSKKLLLNISGHLGISLTNHELSSSLKLFNQTTQDYSYKFSSLNLVLAAGSELRYFVLKKIFINVQARYDVHLSGKLNYKENSNAYLQNNEGNAVKSDWSGVRGGVGIGMKL